MDNETAVTATATTRQQQPAVRERRSNRHSNLNWHATEEGYPTEGEYYYANAVNAYISSVKDFIRYIGAPYENVEHMILTQLGMKAGIKAYDEK